LRDLLSGENVLRAGNEQERAQFSRDTTLATLASVVAEL
jgi:hypothetical protein